MDLSGLTAGRPMMEKIFQEFIDKNKDGNASLRELKMVCGNNSALNRILMNQIGWLLCSSRGKSDSHLTHRRKRG